MTLRSLFSMNRTNISLSTSFRQGHLPWLFQVWGKMLPPTHSWKLCWKMLLFIILYMVGDLGESLCLKKYWFCSLRKETLVSYYISKTEWETYIIYAKLYFAKVVFQGSLNICSLSSKDQSQEWHLYLWIVSVFPQFWNLRDIFPHPMFLRTFEILPGHS